MKAIVKSWYIQGLGDLEDIHEIPPSFHLRLELEIEYENLNGIDDYSINICDKTGLKKELDSFFESEFEKENYIQSCYFYKTILLKVFNKEEIKRLINDFVKECSGNNWEEINLKLQDKLEYNH